MIHLLAENCNGIDRHFALILRGKISNGNFMYEKSHLVINSISEHIIYSTYMYMHVSQHLFQCKSLRN